MSTVKKFPKKPLIRKLGTIGCNNMVETTPIVFNGELYRFEVVRRKSFTSEVAEHIKHWSEIDELPCLRFVHVKTNASTPYFAEGHTFGFPYEVDGTMYVVTGNKPVWGSDGLVFYKSTDLENWEKHTEISLPGWVIYNMNIAKMDDTYVLLLEICAPVEEAGTKRCTFRFMTSKDMTNWTLTPRECVFNKDEFAGGPGFYTFEGDPYYYVLYLDEHPNYHFANSVARSKDLINWEYSPVNPVLMYDDAEDKKLAHPFFTPKDRERIENTLNINNSDMECCEYLGRTIIYYSWGDQMGTEFLAEACYEGPMHEFFKAFFEA